MAEQAVKMVVKQILDGWDQIVVRVRQNGKRTWMPLSKVEDQQQAGKVVVDLIKSALKEELEKDEVGLF